MTSGLPQRVTAFCRFLARGTQVALLFVIAKKARVYEGDLNLKNGMFTSPDLVVNTY